MVISNEQRVMIGLLMLTVLFVQLMIVVTPLASLFALLGMGTLGGAIFVGFRAYQQVHTKQQFWQTVLIGVVVFVAVFAGLRLFWR